MRETAVEMSVSGNGGQVERYQAGWYHDPYGSGPDSLRYYNGTQWTDHVSDGKQTPVHESRIAQPIGESPFAPALKSAKSPWLYVVLLVSVVTLAAAAYVLYSVDDDQTPESAQPVELPDLTSPDNLRAQGGDGGSNDLGSAGNADLPDAEATAGGSGAAGAPSSNENNTGTADLVDPSSSVSVAPTPVPTNPPVGPTVQPAPQPAPTTFRHSADLGLSRPMVSPSCDGSSVVIVRSSIEPGSYFSEIQSSLRDHPGAEYLQTAATGCGSLRQSLNGNDIYAVFYGPYPSVVDACQIRNSVGGDSYVKRLGSHSWEIIEDC